MLNTSIDILENDLLYEMPEVLNALLLDHTTHRNILWCTNDYEGKGKGFGYHDEIRPELITGEHGMVIRPRVRKSKEQQTDRSKDMAEVFTPSWVCNAQNNLVDEAWFGRKDVFNIENSENHTWQSHTSKIRFPRGKKWKDYIKANRMEMACGEAPYLVSRYDTTTGDYIPVENRIGLLDRKLRVVSERTKTDSEWITWALTALQSTYGFDWQGDSLLLAREAIFVTFIEYYQLRWNTTDKPKLDVLIKAAEIISWNLWQMDGLKFGIPSYEPLERLDNGLFESQFNVKPENRFCRIMQWTETEPLNGEEIAFCKLLKTSK